jgi:hypothetical protein
MLIEVAVAVSGEDWTMESLVSLARQSVHMARCTRSSYVSVSRPHTPTQPRSTQHNALLATMAVLLDVTPRKRMDGLCARSTPKTCWAPNVVGARSVYFVPAGTSSLVHVPVRWHQGDYRRVLRRSGTGPRGRKSWSSLVSFSEVLHHTRHRCSPRKPASRAGPRLRASATLVR